MVWQELRLLCLQHRCPMLGSRDPLALQRLADLVPQSVTLRYCSALGHRGWLANPLKIFAARLVGKQVSVKEMRERMGNENHKPVYLIRP